MGWLHATPEKQDKPRMQMYGDGDYRLRMPEVEAPHILQIFFESGMCASGGMGPAALTWVEIRSFCEMTALELTPWEAEQVMMMSRTYASSLNRSKDPMTPPPFTAEETADEVAARRQAVVEQMMALKRSRNKKPSE